MPFFLVLCPSYLTLNGFARPLFPEYEKSTLYKPIIFEQNYQTAVIMSSNQTQNNHDLLNTRINKDSTQTSYGEPNSAQPLLGDLPEWDLSTLLESPVAEGAFDGLQAPIYEPTSADLAEFAATFPQSNDQCNDGPQRSSNKGQPEAQQERRERLFSA